MIHGEVVMNSRAFKDVEVAMTGGKVIKLYDYCNMIVIDILFLHVCTVFCFLHFSEELEFG